MEDETYELDVDIDWRSSQTFEIPEGATDQEIDSIIVSRADSNMVEFESWTASS